MSSSKSPRGCAVVCHSVRQPAPALGLSRKLRMAYRAFLFDEHPAAASKGRRPGAARPITVGRSAKTTVIGSPLAIRLAGRPKVPCVTITHRPGVAHHRGNSDKRGGSHRANQYSTAPPPSGAAANICVTSLAGIGFGKGTVTPGASFNAWRIGQGRHQSARERRRRWSETGSCRAMSHRGG